MRYNFATNLASQSQKLLRFLQVVHTTDRLFDEHVLKAAIRRYELYWLPLKAAHPDKELTPPLDIEWVWYVHMLAPEAYSRDCQNAVDKLVDHSFPEGPEALNRSMDNARNIWREMYRGEPFDTDLRADWSQRPLPRYTTRISYDIVSAVNKQEDFYYQVCLPHFQDKVFLEKALERYENFVSLVKDHRDFLWVAPYDIELLWRAHLLQPVTYSKDMLHAVGFLIDHRYVPDEYRKHDDAMQLQNRIKQVWWNKFREGYSCPGTMSRGEPPSSTLWPEETSSNEPTSIAPRHDVITPITNKFQVKIQHIAMFNYYSLKGIGAVLNVEVLDRSHKRVSDWMVVKRKHPKTEWGEDPRDKRMFNFDANENSHLRFVLEKVKGSKTEIMAYGDLPFLHEVRPEEPQTVDATFALVRYRGKGSTPGPEEGHVELVAMVIPLDESNVLVSAVSPARAPAANRYLMQPGSFALEAAINVDNWLPVTLPMDYGKHKGFMATHSILQNERKLYSARVILSVEAMTAAVQVWDRDKKMLTVAQTIGTNQIPLPTQISPRAPRAFGLQPRLGERCVIIRDAQGDYGVAIGRWRVYKMGREQQMATTQNPGFLQVRFYNLRSHTLQLVEVPSRQNKTGPFNFTFKLGDVTYDMTSGLVDMTSGGGANRAANLTAGIAVAMLFSLCNPWSGRGQVMQPGSASSGNKTRASDLTLAHATGYNSQMVPSNFALRRAFGDYFGVFPVKDDRYEGCFWGNQSDGQFGYVPDEVSGGFSAAHGAVQLKPPENIVPPGHQANYDQPGTQPAYGRQVSSSSQQIPGYNTYQSIDSSRGFPSASNWQANNTNYHPNRYSQSLGVY